MTTADVRRLYERIDTLADDQGQKLAAIDTKLSGIVAVCTICRGVVLGNGRDSIDRRVTRLEMASRFMSKWAWGAVAMVSSVIGGVTVAGITWALLR